MRSKLFVCLLISLVIISMLSVVVAEDDITITPTSTDTTTEDSTDEETIADENNKPDETTDNSTLNDSLDEDGKKKLPIDDPKKAVEIIGKDAKDALIEGAKGAVGDKGEEGFVREVPVMPEIFQMPTKIVFGLKDEGDVNLDKFLILVILFFLILSVMYGILDMVSPLNELTNTMILLGVMIILSAMGFINLASEYLSSGLSPTVLKVIGIILIVVVVLLIFSKTARGRLKSFREEEQAFLEGARQGSNEERVNAIGEALSE